MSLSIEALWTVDFITNVQKAGSGVAIFETNRLFGGDSMMYYLGKYSLKNGQLDADIRVTMFSGGEAVFNNVGDVFDIKIKGSFSEGCDEFKCIGVLIQDTNQLMNLTFKKRAQLP